jgi:hypothetical protein
LVQQTQVRAHDLIESGNFRQAVRVLRKQAQLGRSEARDAASRLRSGAALPDFPMPGGPDLASRVRIFRDSGRRKEAIFAVRSDPPRAIIGALSQPPRPGKQWWPTTFPTVAGR